MQENFGVEVICTPNIHKQQSLPIIPTSHLHSGPSWNASSGRKMPWKLWREPPNCSTALEMMQLDDGRKTWATAGLGPPNECKDFGWKPPMIVGPYRKFFFCPIFVLPNFGSYLVHIHISCKFTGIRHLQTLGISPLVSLPMYRCRLMSSQLLRSLNTGSNWYQWSGSRDNLQDS